MSAPVFNPEETPEGVNAVVELGELRMHREEAKLRSWMLMGMLLVFMAAGITLTFFWRIELCNPVSFECSDVEPSWPLRYGFEGAFGVLGVNLYRFCI